MIHIIVARKDYKNRVSRSKRNTAISAVIFFFFTFMIADNVLIATVVTGLILITQISIIKSHHHYFIEEIKILGSEVDIVYMDKEERKVFNGSLNEMSFKIKFEIKGESSNLTIYNKGRLLLKQYKDGEWDQLKFNEIVEEVRMSMLRM